MYNFRQSNAFSFFKHFFFSLHLTFFPNKHVIYLGPNIEEEYMWACTINAKDKEYEWNPEVGIQGYIFIKTLFGGEND